MVLYPGLVASLVSAGLLAPAAQALGVSLTPVGSGPARTVDIQAAGDGSGRLFLVQQDGRIFVMKDGALLPAPFLDISSRTRGQGERGLLGLAFPRGFAATRRFYVNYTNLAGDTVIARYRVTADPEGANPATEEVVLMIPQPFSNHNGGQLQFGPDGYLYIGTGDGGSAGDPQNNAQDPGVLLGKMLRIDVESDPGPYRVPPSNPFVGDSRFRPEIWSLGLRNPWRFSFDRASGDLWIGDVGQNRAEEVNFQPAASRGGENYGWRRMEGLRCFEADCVPIGLTLPVLEYGRDLGFSVTGGYVYRGVRSPGLRGTYLYGDFGSGRLWGLRRAASEWRNSLLLQTGLNLSTFGQDEAGEVYVADYGSGAIHRIEASGAGEFEADAVVNGASSVPGLVAGSAATAFLAGLYDASGIAGAGAVPLPREIEGVRVLVDGEPAPLFGIANSNGLEQVNFQAPFSLAGNTSAVVRVVREGVFDAEVRVPVLAQQPGVFTLDGVHAVVVRHADNTLISQANPLRAGEYAYFYAAGLGAVSNAPGDGEAGPGEPLAVALASPEVAIGGVPCEVTFAGLAPGLVGVYQVNIRLGRGTPSGRPDLVARQGEAASPPVRVFVE